MKKILYALLALPTLMYIGAVLYMYNQQQKLMYYPSADIPNYSVWSTIESKSGDVLGYNFNRKSDTTVVLFHGNVGSAVHRTYFEKIFPWNVNIIVAEYPGFGANIKKNITKDNILAQSRDLMSQIRSPHTIVVGESLGTGIAAQMAQEYSVEKMLLLTPYSTIAEVAQERYWWLPVSYLLKDNFDTVGSVEKYKGHSMIVLSELDRVIPVKFGQKVADHIRQNKTEIMVKNAGHSSWWQFMTAEQKQELLKFIKS